MDSTADLLFDLEDAESLPASDGHHGKMPSHELEALARRLELAARQPSELAKKLHCDVTALMQHVAEEKPRSMTVVSFLATKLAARGYNVGVRVALGGGSDCFRSLRHQFLVVHGSGDYVGMEFIVEPSLRQHFAIPHPSPEYAFLLSRTPDVFVGGSCRLVPIIQTLCKHMAESFARQGLALPPWRREPAMLSKWLPNHSRVKDLPLDAWNQAAGQPQFEHGPPHRADSTPWPVLASPSHQRPIAAAAAAITKAETSSAHVSSTSASPSPQPASVTGSLTPGSPGALSPVSVLSHSALGAPRMNPLCPTGGPAAHAAEAGPMGLCAGGVTAVVKVTGFAVRAAELGAAAATAAEPGGESLRTAPTPMAADDSGIPDPDPGAGEVRAEVRLDLGRHGCGTVDSSAPYGFKQESEEYDKEYDSEAGDPLLAGSGTPTAALRLMLFGPSATREGPNAVATAAAAAACTGVARAASSGPFCRPRASATAMGIQRRTNTGMLPPSGRPAGTGLLSAKLLMLLPPEPAATAAAAAAGTGSGACRRLETRAPQHPHCPAVHLVRLGWPSAAGPAAAPYGAARWPPPPPPPCPLAAERSWLPWAVGPLG